MFVDDVPTLRAPERQYAALAAASDYSAPRDDPFDRRLSADTDLKARQEFGGASVRAVWEFGSSTLTSVTRHPSPVIHHPSPSRYMWFDAYTVLNVRAGYQRHSTCRSDTD